MSGTAGNTSAMCRFRSNGLLVNIPTGRSVLSCRASESTARSGSIPLGCAEGIPHAFAESLQVAVRRYDPALRLVLEPRMPDGGMDRVRALPAPRREECQPALDPVVTEDAVHIEDDCLDQERSL